MAPVIETSTLQAERVEQLTRALTSESEALQELRETLVVQRQAVALHDQAAVESSIHAMGRVILTLQEVRRQRHALLALIADGEPITLADVDAHVTGGMPADFRAAQQNVAQLATATANDLTINHHVLDRVLQAGDAFLQRLFSSTMEPSPSYAPVQDGEEHSEALLFNRTA